MIDKFMFLDEKVSIAVIFFERGMYINFFF